MFKGCDSLWCCWMDLMGLIGHGLWLARWPLAVYALLYVVGAAVFLLTLRIQSEDGTLTVDRASIAYMLAHPMRYGGLRNHKDQSSICLFYARMFNMLLFVWPVLGLYFIVMLTVISAGGLLLIGEVAYPDLSEPGFFGSHEVVPFTTAWITVPAALITLMIYKRGPLLHFLGMVGWAVLCLLPVLIVIGLISSTVLGLRTNSEGALAVKEAFAAKKDKFCKLVKFSGGNHGGGE